MRGWLTTALRNPARASPSSEAGVRDAGSAGISASRTRSGALVLPAQKGDEQDLEVGEAPVDDDPVDPGVPRDGLHAERIEPLVGEQREGDVEQLLATLGARHPASAATGRRRRRRLRRGGLDAGWPCGVGRGQGEHRRRFPAGLGIGGNEHQQPLCHRGQAFGREASRVSQHQPGGVLTGGDDEPRGERVIEPEWAPAAGDAPVEQLGDALGDEPAAATDPLAQLGRASRRGHQHESPGARVGPYRAEERADRIGEELLGVGVAGVAPDDLQQGRERSHLLAIDEREHQPLQISEHVVDHRPGDTGAGGDGLDGDGIESALGEHVERRVEQLAAADLGGEAASAGVRGAHRSPETLARHTA